MTSGLAARLRAASPAEDTASLGGGHKNPHLDPKMQPANLTEEEITALVKFMEVLEGKGYQDKPPAVFPK